MRICIWVKKNDALIHQNQMKCLIKQIFEKNSFILKFVEIFTFLKIKVLEILLCEGCIRT